MCALPAHISVPCLLAHCSIVCIHFLTFKMGVSLCFTDCYQTPIVVQSFCCSFLGSWDHRHAPKAHCPKAVLRDGAELPSTLSLPLVGPDDLGAINKDDSLLSFSYQQALRKSLETKTTLTQWERSCSLSNVCMSAADVGSRRVACVSLLLSVTE